MALAGRNADYFAPERSKLLKSGVPVNLSPFTRYSVDFIRILTFLHVAHMENVTGSTIQNRKSLEKVLKKSFVVIHRQL